MIKATTNTHERVCHLRKKIPIELIAQFGNCVHSQLRALFVLCEVNVFFLSSYACITLIDFVVPARILYLHINIGLDRRFMMHVVRVFETNITKHGI